MRQTIEASNEVYEPQAESMYTRPGRPTFAAPCREWARSDDVVLGPYLFGAVSIRVSG
jgi:hypothetical protein